MPINFNYNDEFQAWSRSSQLRCLKICLSKPEMISEMQSYFSMFDDPEDPKTFDTIDNSTLPDGLKHIHEECQDIFK